MSGSNEEVQSRPASPAGSGGSGTLVLEKRETSETQPPVSEILKFQLPLIGPQSFNGGENETKEIAYGVRRDGEGPVDDEANGVIHPSQYEWWKGK